jgi:predicted secreted protein
MALNFPSSPTVGDLFPTPAQAGVPQYKWDGNAWVAQVIPDAPTYVKKAGDTMTGDLWISKASATLALQTPDQTTQPILAFVHGALTRWGLYVQGNAAATLAISRYDNTGSYVDSPLTFDRSDGRPYLTLGPNAPLGIATKQYVDSVAGGFPVGTLMLFQQTAAPTGWTKQTTHNDKALRVVSGNCVNGGTYTFSSLFANVSSGGATLDTNTLAVHDHPTYPYTLNAGGGSGGFHYESADGNGLNAYGIVYVGTRGQGAAHYHGIDLRVLYLDVIIASKN